MKMPGANLAETGLVSIVVPVYNVEDFLRECLDSVLRQTCVNWEVILVDDGSTDGCPEICDQYAARDARFHVIHQPNRGLSHARNRGVSGARGEFLCFLDSDDCLAENAMEALVHAAGTRNLDVVLFDGVAMEEDGSAASGDFCYRRRANYPGVKSGGELFAELMRNGDYLSAACLLFIRRSLLVRTGLRFLDGILHEDELFTPCLLLRSARSGHHPEALYFRRIRAGSIMTASSRERRIGSRVEVVEGLAREYRGLERAAGHVRAALRLRIRQLFDTTLDLYLRSPPDVRSACRGELGRLRRTMETLQYTGDRRVFLKCRMFGVYTFYRRMRLLASGTHAGGKT